jgi:hypothetical protein
MPLKGAHHLLIRKISNNNLGHEYSFEVKVTLQSRNDDLEVRDDEAGPMQLWISFCSYSARHGPYAHYQHVLNTFTFQVIRFRLQKHVTCTEP